jgi:hypothetical protein
MTTQVPRWKRTKLRFSFTLSEQNFTSSVAEGAGQAVVLAGLAIVTGWGSVRAGRLATRVPDFLKFGTGRTIAVARPKKPARKRAVNSATLDESGVFEALAGLSMRGNYKILTVNQY